MSKRSRRRRDSRAHPNAPRPILRRQVPAKAPVRTGLQRWQLAVLAVFLIGSTVAGLALLFNQATPNGAAPGGATGTSGGLTGLQTGPPPWRPDNTSLRARLEADGLQVLTAEGQVQHTHQHLDLFVDGQPVQVPADIGIDRVNLILSPIHTHDASGILHIESPIVRDFTFGEFFDVWGIRFDARCIGGLCDGNGRVLAVFLNGEPFAGDPRSLVLRAHDEIVVAIGTLALLPSPIPSSYAFPAGL